MKKEILRMDHITCQDNGIQILNHLSMQIFEGEIYGLLCLERHGIEKMVELICNNRPIQHGHVFFGEKLVNSMEYSSYSRNRATLIGRQSRLIKNLSLADNMFVIRPGFHTFIIPKRIIRSQTQRLLDELQIQLSPDVPVDELGALERIMAEILRAIVEGDQLIILFEISDLLSSEELTRLHIFINKIRSRGFAFLYIYNHHEVLTPVCDRISIFKFGRIEKVYPASDDIQEHIRIFARYSYERMSLLEPNDTKSFNSLPMVLALHHIQMSNIQDLDFSIKAGENVLLLDQNNTITDELMDLLGGVCKPFSGWVEVQNGTRLCGRRIALIKRDPIHTTLFPELSFLDNLCFQLAEKVPFFWQKNKFRENVDREFRPVLGDLLDIPKLNYLHSIDLYTLVYYRYLISRPDLVVCIQPLSGADMYMRTHILGLIAKLRESGIAVLVLDTELYDTLNVADRMIQVEKGRIAAEYPRSRFDEVRILNKENIPD